MGFGSPTGSANRDTTPAKGSVIFSVPHAGDEAEKLRRRYGKFTVDDSPSRFGQPSSYSLSRVELSHHIRLLRRQGWQSWEIKQRFDYWPAA